MTLRNTVIAFFLILAAVVVTRTDRDQTPLPASATAGTVRCSVSPQRVTGTGGRLTGAARYSCDSPGPGKLALTVRLQRAAGGGWATVAEQSFTATRADPQRTRQVSAACQAGTFRTQVEWAVNGGKTTGRTGSERSNPCR
jgi:hypothetical protein